MTGVYGTFLEHFNELAKAYHVWDTLEKGEPRTIKAVFIPTKGDGLHRQKYTSGNTAIDTRKMDTLYIRSAFKSQIKDGDYIQKVGDNITMRVMKVLPYDEAGGYFIATVEMVTGSTPEKNQPLPIKEPYFA